MKFLDLFSGVGGFRSGLEVLGHECVGYVEKDIHARNSYEAIYNTDNEWTKGDITQVTDEEFCELKGKVDIITGGFPCNSFSTSGHRGGFEDTRGTLFFDIVRAANIIKPKYLLLENVKGLASHDGGNTIDTIVSSLNEIGYRVDYELINSKYFGVPQNRERIMIVAIKEERYKNEVWTIKGTNTIAKSKKRISKFDNVKTFNFNFPIQEKVDSLLKDVLEESVDDKFYLTDYQISKIPLHKYLKGRVIDAKGLLSDIKDSQVDNPNPLMVMGMYVNSSEKFSTKPLSGIARTLTTNSYNNGLIIPVHNASVETPTFKVRKLTPLETWRLQGFTDEQFYKAEKVNSISQLYKQSGNSVTVNVIKKIAEQF